MKRLSSNTFKELKFSPLGRQLFTITHNLYNSDGRIIAKITVDEDNRLVSETRYYYEQKALVRFTVDNNPSDSAINQEQRFDLQGNKIFYEEFNPYNGNRLTSRYEYDARGLMIKEEYYFRGVLQYCKHYRYQ